MVCVYIDMCICVYTQTHTHTHTHICTWKGILCSPKKKEILSYATMWMNLKDFMLSKISQSQKGRSRVILLI